MNRLDWNEYYEQVLAGVGEIGRISPDGNVLLRRTPLGSALLVAAVLAWAEPTSAQSIRADTAGAPGATVEDLLGLVRNFNPDLAAAALDSEAAAAKVGAAGALDDPTVNFIRDEGFRQTMVTVSQEFPLWGKRQLRSDIAEANAKAARNRQGSVTKALEERVKVAFAQYYQTDNAIRVTHEIHGLLHTVAGTARTRYAQGLANQSDAIRAELETNRLDLEVAVLERDEQTVKARINALIARPGDSALSPPSKIRTIPPAAALTVDELMARARPANPVLAATRAEIAAAKGEHQLVEKSYYPDVTVIVGFDDVAPNNSPRVVAGLGVKVPFQWGVRDAEARAASAKRAAAQRRLDGAMLDIESELGSALATLRQTEKSRAVLKNVLSPQSEAAYRSALVSYQLGRGDLTPVLEAAHRQLEIRIELLRVETDAQTALAAIERLVGEDL